MWQARRDTAQEPSVGASDWLLIARAGRDGHDGASLRLRGAYDLHKRYDRLDVVEFGGEAFVARRNGPGLCPGEDWLPLSARGHKGEQGAPGPRGPKGDKGSPAPSIYSWTVDVARFRAVFFTADGKPGPELNLTPLFENYHVQVSG